jgi:hypothetical protein
MARRFSLLIAAAAGAIVMALVAGASAATVEGPLRSATAEGTRLAIDEGLPRWAIEIEASQTLSWSVDEKVVAGGCQKQSATYDFLAPRRGNGKLTWSFTARAVTKGSRLRAPARGSIEGTYVLYGTQGYWEEPPPSECTMPKQEDELAPTSGCGPFASKGWADAYITGRRLRVEAGVFHKFAEALRCPFLPDLAGDVEKLTPFNFEPLFLPLTSEELSFEKEIRRAKTIQITQTFPLERGVYRTKQVNTWRVTMIPADELRIMGLAAPSFPVAHRLRFGATFYPPGTRATKFEWEMKRTDQSKWTQLGETPVPEFHYTVRAAGHFKWRAIARNAVPPGGRPRTLTTPAYPLEVRFPTWAEISRDEAVKSLRDGLWSRTLNFANERRKQEYGSWITLDTCSGRYGRTATIEGLVVKPNEVGGIDLGPRPPDTPSPDPVKGCSTYTVASFHTHTPATHWTREEWKGVGPSPNDKENATRRKTPGGVYDYIEKPPGSGSESIPPGHPKGSPAQFYLSGPPQRPTPR